MMGLLRVFTGWRLSLWIAGVLVAYELTLALRGRADVALLVGAAGWIFAASAERKLERWQAAIDAAQATIAARHARGE